MKKTLSTVARFAALTLLVAIGGDIVGDANCDPLGPIPSQDSIRSMTESGDECQSVCVPDCFCCSRATSETPTIEIAFVGPKSAIENVAPTHQLDGVFAPIFHPPLLRA